MENEKKVSWDRMKAKTSGLMNAPKLNWKSISQKSFLSDDANCNADGMEVEKLDGFPDFVTMCSLDGLCDSSSIACVVTNVTKGNFPIDKGEISVQNVMNDAPGE